MTNVDASPDARERAHDRARAAAALDRWFANPGGEEYQAPGVSWDDNELAAMHAALQAPTVESALAAFGVAPGGEWSTPGQDAANRELMLALRDGDGPGLLERTGGMLAECEACGASISAAAPTPLSEQCLSSALGVMYAQSMTDQHFQQRTEEIPVNHQGRVTIPADMRRVAGLEPGETAYVHMEQGAVVLENRATYTARIRREIADSWTGDPQVSVVDELAADRRAEAAREDDAA